MGLHISQDSPSSQMEAGSNTMRLNFTYPSIDEIEKGIKKLGEAIKQRLNK